MSVSIRALTKRFGPHTALDNVSVDIEPGSFFVVLGPSGCGKSTLLRLIAGLETLDAGEIAIAGETVASSRHHVPPEARNVGVVFQSYALWPHMSVRDNVAFPVETAGLPSEDRRRRVDTSLETVGLAGFATRKPASLSGGQRQRVALARCLAQAATTILMDEPLANLDPHLRQAMEEELAAFHRANGATTLYITHDQREAMALADRIALLWEGRLLQADSPEALYRRPASDRVARFIGRSALVDARIGASEGARGRVTCGPFSLIADLTPGTPAGPGRLVLRPEDVRLSNDAEAVQGTVTRATYRGGFWEVTLDVKGVNAPLVAQARDRVVPGERLPVSLSGGWVLPQD